MADEDFIQLVKPVPLFMPTACELPSDAFLLQFAEHAAACLRCVLCGGCTLQFWICKRAGSPSLLSHAFMPQMSRNCSACAGLL